MFMSKVIASNAEKYIFKSRLVRHNSGVSALLAVVQKELDGIEEAGTWKHERVLTGEQAVRIGVSGSNSKLLNFCANNYLGLSSHSEVVKAGKDAFDKYGAGLSSVRFICGTQVLHKELEQKIANFHKMDDAILYTSCFDANAGVFETLLSSEDAVLSDELNHASVIDGIRLCKANRFRYKHKDLNDLESKLKEAQSSRLRLIATDGVFSMDGNVAPLKEICELSDKYNAIVFVDDSHATGFIGPTGRGTAEFCGVEDRVHVINSTLGKAMGGASGGYTAGPKAVIDLLRNRSRPYLFSNSLPPQVAACASKAFDLVTSSTEYPEKVITGTKLFRSEMSKAGFKIIGDDHAICPVMLGDAKLAAQFADELLNEGIYVIGFSYPVVPKGKARIRVQISAAHSLDDIREAVAAFVRIGKKLSVI